MLHPTAKNRPPEHFFFLALLLAGLLHGIVLTRLVMTMPGTPEQFRVEMIFWGSILRHQDLQPRAFAPAPEIERAPLLEASSLPGFSGMAVLRDRAGQSGVIVDKPAGISSWLDIQPLPVKFLTRRVEADEAQPEAVPGIPDAPSVPLRMPRP